MIITIQNTQKDLALSLKSIREMIPRLLQKLEIHTDEVILHFVSKKKMGKVHADFFNDPSPTDCMSFPLDPPESPLSKSQSHTILGEIFVCPQVAIEFAEENNLDPYEETTLYIIHGLLHLLGYDDIDPKMRKKMRAMEKHCIELITPFSLKKLERPLP